MRFTGSGIVFFFLLCGIHAAPIRRRSLSDDESNGDAPSSKKPKIELSKATNKACIFSSRANQPDERLDKIPTSKIRSQCSEGGLHRFEFRLNDQMNGLYSLIDTKVGNLYGAENAADLLLNRGSGVFVQDWEDQAVKNNMQNLFVCNDHWKELITSWKTGFYYHFLLRKKDKRVMCSVPEQFDNEHAGSRPLLDTKKKKTFYLSKRQSRAILLEKGFLLHVGLRKSHSIEK